MTGGTRGIGRAVAQVLKKDGHQVVVTGTSEKGEPPPGCGYMACDFSDLQAVRRFAGRVSKLDFSILVNNAGMNKVGELASYDPKDFIRIQQVNVTAPFILCQSVVPGMQKRRFGRILNVASIFGVVSRAGRSAYSASKFALLGMSRALALEVAKDNILVNCIAPGFVDTDLTRRILGKKGLVQMAGRIPMGRLADAQEIAQVVRFLVSSENSYITGQNVIVDGGYTCE